MAAVAHFPASLDKGPLERARRPLAAIAAMLLVIDLMGLGMHLADSVTNPLANDTPTRARARVIGPPALVPTSPGIASAPVRSAPRTAEPLGCLAIDSGCYAGPPAPNGTPGGGGTATNPPGGTTTPTTPAPKPLAQADVGIPAVGAQVDLGVGGGCTGLNLTVLNVGDCPATTGSGPVVIKLGGSLLGN